MRNERGPDRARGDERGSRSGSFGRNWTDGLRWFAAEFLVVVSGVLVALALNAYYQGRVDAGREAGYLQQMATDLAESEARLQEAVAANQDQLGKLTELLKLFDSKSEVPSIEAFNDLKILSFTSEDPVLSTAQAIVETGDLHLITDDLLRSEIIHYVGAGNAYLDTQTAISWEWLTPGIREYYRIIRPGLGSGHELGLSPAEALSREALYDVAFDLRLGYANIIRFQERMLEDIREIQRQVARSIEKA